MNLQVPPKPNESPPPPPPPPSPPTIQLSFEAESASSPHSSSSDKGLCYGLRENPKRSFRLSDPEFADTGSVILQDRESETESSKNPTRKRSKRAWKLSAFDQPEQKTMKKIEIGIPSNNKNESLSSVSDTTTEEDVAFCLMMLSRDKWKRQHELLEEHKYEEQEEQEYEEEEDADDDDEDDDDDGDESDESEEEMKSLKITTTKVRGKYKCETCNKVFRSYQALGGHRASHKKIKVIAEEQQPQLEHKHNNDNNGAKKIHECPVCFRVFASGQALGGHKRTHVIGAAPAPTTTATVTATAIETATPARSFANFGDSLIDLNLPAPMDDVDVSQFEDSAVSDAEFVKSH